VFCVVFETKRRGWFYMYLSVHVHEHVSARGTCFFSLRCARGSYCCVQTNKTRLGHCV